MSLDMRFASLTFYQSIFNNVMVNVKTAFDRYGIIRQIKGMMVIFPTNSIQTK